MSDDEVLGRLTEHFNATSRVEFQLGAAMASTEKSRLRSDLQHAAVLIVLVKPSYQVILTVRSAELRAHGGEVSFPGGRSDETDGSPVETALREAEEEIGLPRSSLTVIGTGWPLVTRFGLLVTPVIAVLHTTNLAVSTNPEMPPKQLTLDSNPNGPQLVLQPNPTEVAEIFLIPLEEFLKDTCHSVLILSNEFEPERELSWTIHVFHFPIQNKPGKNYVVFGLTAYFLVDLAIIAFQRLPQFQPIPDCERPLVSPLKEPSISPSSTTATQEVITRLEEYSPTPSSPQTNLMHLEIPMSKQAGVLVALVNNSDTLYVILTVRSSSLRTHGGEVALPGGRWEPSDASITATALREAHEEIGLSLHNPIVFGTLTPLISKHRLLVTPTVALLRSNQVAVESSDEVVGGIVKRLTSPVLGGSMVTLKLSLQEVEEVFLVPLEEFLKADRHREMRWTNPDVPGKFWRAHAFDWPVEGDTTGRTHLIFGLTAAILVEAAMVAFGKNPEFDSIPNADRPQMRPTAGAPAGSVSASASTDTPAADNVNKL